MLSYRTEHEMQLGLNSLSDREKKILVLVAQSYDNREIARTNVSTIWKYTPNFYLLPRTIGYRGGEVGKELS